MTESIRYKLTRSKQTRDETRYRRAQMYICCVCQDGSSKSTVLRFDERRLLTDMGLLQSCFRCRRGQEDSHITDDLIAYRSESSVDTSNPLYADDSDHSLENEGFRDAADGQINIRDNCHEMVPALALNPPSEDATSCRLGEDSEDEGGILGLVDSSDDT